MKTLRVVLPNAALLALLVCGCTLIAGTFTLTLELDDPTTVTSASSVEGTDIDLNNESDYRDNKDKLKDVTDVAVLGRFTNNSSSATTVEVWIIPTPPGTPYTTEAQVEAAPGAKPLWGPFTLAGNETKVIGWDESAALINKAGLDELLAQAKGDGVFSAYALGGGGYNFTITKGAVVVTISAGL
jgi:hypothetical protein